MESAPADADVGEDRPETASGEPVAISVYPWQKKGNKMKDTLEICKILEDDGNGIASPDAHDFGIHGMERRVELLGGTMRIHSRPGGGTKFLFSIPVNAPSEGALENSRRDDVHG